MYCGRFCVFQILVREVDDKKTLIVPVEWNNKRTVIFLTLLNIQS